MTEHKQIRNRNMYIQNKKIEKNSIKAKLSTNRSKTSEYT